jgi:hypothetical protein
MCFAALHLQFGAVGFSSASFACCFVCVTQAPCWEGDSPRHDTAWPVVACMACVVPVVRCIRLIPTTMNVWAVAKVVLAAVELS